MKESTTDEEILFPRTDSYVFPENPFESIGFALSGGGFRAAAYGLGTLSVFDALQLKDPKEENLRLLDKVKFISSASGGTITLLAYTASIRKGISFKDYFRHLNKKLTSDGLCQEALDILGDPTQWEDGEKSRNPINAFARAYHNSLFDFLASGERSLGFIIAPDNTSDATHLDEFCFNASEFYTGLSFRFQGTERDWLPKRYGQFGNNNISINLEEEKSAQSISTLKQIRFGDILAASSCFPLGFEPIMFPRDFSYNEGPTQANLKAALHLKTYSWGKSKKFEFSNKNSKRATREKEFADNGEFGLMDGGICDNQGLYSLLKANSRKDKGHKKNERCYNRFDLMIVSDVTSFYMEPFRESVVKKNDWNQETLQYYWNTVRNYNGKIKKWMSRSYIILAMLAVICLLPLFFEGITFASVMLSILGLSLFVAMAYVNKLYKGFFKSYPDLAKILEKESLNDVYKHYFTEDTFINRTAVNLITQLETVKLEAVLNMLKSRAQSAVTMISDVFLKQIRRLIYDQLFINQAYKYRRLNNPIYRLSFTNNKNRKLPDFDEKEDEDEIIYHQRYDEFKKEVNEFCKITPEMQYLAEMAYNASTTLWFTPEQETAGKDNVRKAIIVTGQFSTCYSLLRYTLSLRHSRNFSSLNPDSKERISNLQEQLIAMMHEFTDNPFFLYEKLTNEKSI
ncbi:patatin-like phospholipase family protein [Flavobacterium sp.]|uniref:patatin-like phospholipase family protein n=1 Tax=Flavobacterium sp. TaxID=239 RepID=UPI003D6BBD21